MTPFVAASTAETAEADAREETQRLFDAHGTSLFRFCRFTLGRADEAEDVVQEAFLKLLRHLDGHGDRTNLKAWLFAVAANACRDRRRWRIRLVPWRPELDPRTTPEPEGRAIDAARAETALRQLSSRDRLLLTLRSQGLSYRDIATAAVISEGSVGRLLARAVERWKTQLESID